MSTPELPLHCLKATPRRAFLPGPPAMDYLDPKTTGLLPLDADTAWGVASEPAISPMALEPLAIPLGEVSILAHLTGETRSRSDLFRASTATKGALNAGDSITGYINALKDHDWFKITLTAGQAYTFQLQAINGSALDSILALRNSTGNVLASNDDSNGTLNSELHFTASSTGNYYLDAGAFRDRSVGQYLLSASEPSLLSSYSKTTGYGEASVERAIEKLLNTSFATVHDQFASGGLYGLDRLDAPEVWAAGYSGQGMVVAVVDTGVDRTHLDLDANIWTNAGEVAGDGIDNNGDGYIDDVYGWNFSDNSANTQDNNGHGTHVAGIIAAENNGFGVTGIAYNAKIMTVKVLDANGSGSLINVAKGIRYAADHGANVINLSLGAPSGSADLQSAVQYAWGKGVAVMMAAGNDSALSPGYPAAYASQYGMAIGAIDRAGNLASFSNRAGTTTLDYVTTAGVGVYSTIAGGGYATYSGTSMATPYMAGAMALLMQANLSGGANRSLAELETLFTSTASNSLVTGMSQTSSITIELSPLAASTRLRIQTVNEAVNEQQHSAGSGAGTKSFNRKVMTERAASESSLHSVIATVDPVSKARESSTQATPQTAGVVTTGWRQVGSANPAMTMLLAAEGLAGGDDGPILDPLTGLWTRPWPQRT